MDKPFQFNTDLCNKCQYKSNAECHSKQTSRTFCWQINDYIDEHGYIMHVNTRMHNLKDLQEGYDPLPKLCPYYLEHVLTMDAKKNEPKS